MALFLLDIWGYMGSIFVGGVDTLWTLPLHDTAHPFKSLHSVQ